MPEAGDLVKPKLVFFFDEAHLLFTDAPAVLLDKIEQVVRLIRSKGVGVYFITQNPADVPDKVLGQLGNRVQHALRAFSPRDQKAVKAAAETMRDNPALNEEAISSERLAIERQADLREILDAMNRRAIQKLQRAGNDLRGDDVRDGLRRGIHRANVATIVFFAAGFGISLQQTPW